MMIAFTGLMITAWNRPLHVRPAGAGGLIAPEQLDGLWSGPSEDPPPGYGRRIFAVGTDICSELRIEDGDKHNGEHVGSAAVRRWCWSD